MPFHRVIVISVSTSVQSQNQNPELDATPSVPQQDHDQLNDNWITNALDLPTKQVSMRRHNPVICSIIYD